MNETDTELYWLIGIVVVIVLSLLLIGFVKFLNDFLQELRYLNNEIGRTEGEEREYWKREKRRLWLSLLPFYRR